MPPTLKQFATRLIADYISYTSQPHITIQNLVKARMDTAQVVANAQQALLDRELEPKRDRGMGKDS